MNGRLGRFTAHGLTETMVAYVVMVLTTAYAVAFLVGLWHRLTESEPLVDANAFKDVLLIAMSYAFGAQSVKKGVEQGTTAALTPPPTAQQQPGQTTTTTTVTEATPKETTP